MAIRDRKRGNKGENPALEMTPMIDVVFQLLIFFIVVTKQEDILARLNAARPAPNKDMQPDVTPPTFIDVEISKNAVIFMGKTLGANLMKPADKINFDELEKGLAEQAHFNKDASVTIRCTADSAHGVLVQILDLCAKYGLTKLNIFSM